MWAELTTRPGGTRLAWLWKYEWGRSNAVERVQADEDKVDEGVDWTR